MVNLIKTILGGVAYLAVIGAILYAIIQFVLTPLFGGESTTTVLLAILSFALIAFGGWKFATKVLFKGKSPW